MTDLQQSPLFDKIKQLPCFDKVIDITAVEQGLSSCCFKVTTVKQAFFVKYQQLPASVENWEAIFTDLAAQYGIAPRLIYRDLFFIVSEFITAPTLHYASINEEKSIEISLTLMAKYHQVPITTAVDNKTELPVLNMGQVIDNLVELLELTAEQYLLINKVKSKLISILKVKSKVICHGDINFTNVLIALGNLSTAPTNNYLIDFECACLADEAFDIAMMIAVNNINLDDKGSKLQHIINNYLFQNNKATDVTINKVMNYLVFCLLINALWYLSKHKQQSNEYYYQQAHQQLVILDRLGFIDGPLADKMR